MCGGEMVYETADLYVQGREHLENSGLIIKGVVLRRSKIRGVFENIPTQMCHFHQKQRKDI